MPLIDKTFIKDLPPKVNIVDYIADAGLPLKKAGKDFTSLCPFHNEKTASFSVSEEKQFYYCHGCQAHGNVIGFAIDYKHLSYPEAIEDVARFASVPVVYQDAPKTAQQSEEDALRDVLKRAHSLYEKQLLSTPAALQYLEERGITLETAKKFGLGYAPANNFITRVLKNVPPEILEKSGLAFKRELDNKIIDRLRDRLVFPIRDERGNLIAFSGRLMTSEKVEKKYINFGETSLFKKGNEAYGLFENKSGIRASGTVLVTEGYMDVIMPNQHGVDNIVAAMGTALTSNAIRKLFKHADHLVFAFDGDAAGERAAVKAMENAISEINENRRISFVFFPDKLDPDEFIRKHGVDEFRKFVDTAMPLSKFVVHHFSKTNDMNIAEGRAKFVVDAMNIVQQITAPVLRHIVADEVRKRVGYHIPLGGLHVPHAAPTPSNSPAAETPPADASQGYRPARKQTFVDDQPSLAIRVLALLLKDPEAAREFEPTWLEMAPSTHQEIEAVKAIVERVRSVRTEVGTDFIFNQFRESDFAPLLRQAASVAQDDQYAQLHELFQYVQHQQARMEVFKGVVRKNIPKPA